MIKLVRNRERTRVIIARKISVVTFSQWGYVKQIISVDFYLVLIFQIKPALFSRVGLDVIAYNIMATRHNTDKKHSLK